MKKICSKCKIEKNLNEFGKDKNTKDGLRYICKECANGYSKKHYKNNLEYYEERNKKWQKENPEYNKKWREDNPDYDKERYDNNPEYIKKWQKENPESQKNWRENNPDYDKNYRNSKTNYIYAERISYADKVKNVDGFLQTKCTYCGKWYFPTISSIQIRIRALNSSDGSENR